MKPSPSQAVSIEINAELSLGEGSVTLGGHMVPPGV